MQYKYFINFSKYIVQVAFFHWLCTPPKYVCHVFFGRRCLGPRRAGTDAYRVSGLTTDHSPFPLENRIGLQRGRHRASERELSSVMARGQKKDDPSAMLLEAVMTGSITRARIALRAGGRLDGPRTPASPLGPLTAAVTLGDANMVDLLLEAGALVNAKGEGGTTALYQAAVTDGPELAQRLIDAGANMAAKTSRGDTPLHYFAERGHLTGLGNQKREGGHTEPQSISGILFAYLAPSSIMHGTGDLCCPCMCLYHCRLVRR